MTFFPCENPKYDTSVTQALNNARFEIDQAATIINRIRGYDGVRDLRPEAVDVAYEYLLDASLRLLRTCEALGNLQPTSEVYPIDQFEMPEPIEA